MNREHFLLTWPEYFTALLEGSKTFELRKDDRDFQVGDTLVLQEYNPLNEELSGRDTFRRVTYVLRDAEQFGLRAGYVVLGLGKPEEE